MTESLKPFAIRICTILTALALAMLACRRGNPGNYEQTSVIPGSLTHDGLERTYLFHIPPSYDEAEPMPLVFALHGGGGTGENMIKLTEEFNDLADEKGFLVVYPDGIEKHWNDGRKIENRRAHADNIDDVGYLKALVEHISQDYFVDPARIYSTGISNGGQMSYRLACEAPGTFAAIAAVVASMSEELHATCSPEEPISVLVLNGTADPMVPWDGGTIRVGRQEFGEAVSARETVDFWIEANQCDALPTVSELPDSDPEDGTRVNRETYQGCASGTSVELFTVGGGGHTWPSGWQYFPEWMVGVTSRDVDANTIIWSFFSEHFKGVQDAD
jgi:polyhydroxybutyrate depolymerase